MEIAKLKSLVFSAMLLFGLIALASLTAMGQVLTGNIKGVISDPNGAAVTGASITVKSQATGAETKATTDNSGSFVVTNLTPGKYTVTIETAGFKKKEIRDFNVGLGDNSLPATALDIGNPTETVTVVSGASEEIIQRDQSQLATNFETRKIEELPSNVAGGGIDTLALLAPGVINNPGAFTNTNGAGLSVNGQRGRSNNFQIDGSDNNDLSIGGPSYFVDNQDSVQEYQIITSQFSAQYGRNQGAVVNIVTKSGTNEFHGSAFEFFRDRKHLDSLNNIERRSGQEDPLPRLRHVFGGTVGGPIKKNRAFFFASYQGIRQSEE